MKHAKLNLMRPNGPNQLRQARTTVLKKVPNSTLNSTNQKSHPLSRLFLHSSQLLDLLFPPSNQLSDKLQDHKLVMLFQAALTTTSHLQSEVIIREISKNFLSNLSLELLDCQLLSQLSSVSTSCKTDQSNLRKTTKCFKTKVFR